MATRSERLSKLAANFPDGNSDVAKKQSAALNIQARAMAPAGKSQAQAMAGQVAAGQSRINLQDQTTQQGQQLQLGQARLQANTQEAKQGLARQDLSQKQSMQTRNIQSGAAQQQNQIAARKQITSNEVEQAKELQQLGILQDNRLQVLDINQREQIAALGGDVKDQLFDAQMRFEQDEMGRKFSNGRQLADYAAANTKNNIEFNARMQDIEQAAKMEIIMLEAAQAKLEQALTQGYNDGKQKLDQESRRKIVAAQAAMAKSIAEKKRKGQVMSNMMSGAATGATAGSAAGPYGAVIGGVVGAGAGYMASQ